MTIQGLREYCEELGIDYDAMVDGAAQHFTKPLPIEIPSLTELDDDAMVKWDEEERWSEWT